MKKIEGMPSLVYIGLLGINSKPVAYFYVVLSLLLAVGTVIYGFWNPVYFSGAALVLAAYWYYYAIRWMDKNAAWDN